MIYAVPMSVCLFFFNSQTLNLTFTWQDYIVIALLGPHEAKGLFITTKI